MVEVGTFGRPQFAAALAGSTPDDVDWARRKRNVVERFCRSSYAIGLELQRKGATLEGRYGLGPGDHAAHGGAFPLAVEGADIVGCVVVSGLPQREDHMAVVRALCAVRFTGDLAGQDRPGPSATRTGLVRQVLLALAMGRPPRHRWRDEV